MRHTALITGKPRYIYFEIAKPPKNENYVIKKIVVFQYVANE